MGDRWNGYVSKTKNVMKVLPQKGIFYLDFDPLWRPQQIGSYISQKWHLKTEFTHPIHLEVPLKFFGENVGIK